MTSEVLKTKMKDQKKKPFSVNNSMIVPVYNSTAYCYAPYAVSPVLLPYVEAPVRFAKSKSKKETEKRALDSSRKGFFVRAYKFTPIPPYFPANEECINCQMPLRMESVPYYCPNGHCLNCCMSQRMAVPPHFSYNGHYLNSCVSRRLGIPFAMRINPEAHRLNQGYVSALSLPAAYAMNQDADIAFKSDLNPLSRPYTPPSRLKQCSCHPKLNSADDFVKCQKCQRRGLSSPEPSSDFEVANEDSRAPTPISRAQTPASSCSLKYSGGGDSSSEVDSGVEGECDDEKLESSDLLFDFGKQTGGDKDESSIEDLLDVFNGFNSTSGEHVKEELSPQLTSIIDFLCLHLDSYEWRTVARELGVNDVIIQSVDYDFYDNFREQMEFVFSVWAKSQKLKSYSDSYAMTVKALSEIGRKDLVTLLKDNKTE